MWSNKKARTVLQSKGHVAESKEERFSENSRKMARTRKRQDHDIGEQEVIIYDRLALERHDYAATKAERMRYSENWVLTPNAEGKHSPRQLLPDYEEAKRECQRLQDEFMEANSHPSTQVNKDVKIRINDFKDLKNMTTLLIERQDGDGIRSSRETCRILRLRRLHRGKIPLDKEVMVVTFLPI